MEETLGKRIVANRKRMGMTQDALAEQLGVTAQAVSKWENDQSCPDITMVPRLADIFGITTDELLGVERKDVPEVQAVEPIPADERAEPEVEGSYSWEIPLGSGRRGSLGMAVWVLAVGGLMIASHFLGWNVSFWDILWPVGLVVFGLLWGVSFSFFFRIASVFFGGYFLLCNLNLLPAALGQQLLFAVFLLLFGFSLLLHSFRFSGKRKWSFLRVRKQEGTSSFRQEGERFECITSFADDSRVVELPQLALGQAKVSFGDLKLDLTQCGAFRSSCRLELSCVFGNIEVWVPKCCRIESAARTSFGNFDVSGNPDPEAGSTLYIDASVSFGDVMVKYL